jgi:hypothetical protein
MNIDKMEAGPELDALVAEKVMGWSVCDTADGGKAGIAPRQTCSAVRVPPYSTDISAAWQVVERLCTTYPGLGVGGPFANRFVLEVPNNEPLACKARFCHQGHVNEAGGEAAPLAICRAALKAVGVTEIEGVNNC